MNDPAYIYQPHPMERRLEQARRAVARAEERERKGKSTIIVWLREQEREELAEIKGMIGTGTDLYAIKRRIELEARLSAWREAITHLHKVWRSR